MSERTCETCRFFRPCDGVTEVNAEGGADAYQPANPETVSDGMVTLARLTPLGDLGAAHALADRLKGGES